MIRGLASAFNSYVNAEWPNYIEAGAWTNALAKYGHSVLLLWSHHDEEPPIGTAKVWQSSIGLEYEATLANTPRASEIAQLIEAGVLRAVSIGFDAGKSYFKTINGEKSRFITEIKRLYEISVVNWGADQKATAYPVKTSQSIDDDELAEMLQDHWLKHAASKYGVRFEYE